MPELDDDQDVPRLAGIPAVTRRHAVAAATRWWRRTPAYLDQGRPDFRELADFDESIDAHLDGLHVAGELGLHIVEQALDSEAPDSAADIFTALALAYLTRDAAVIKRMHARTDPLPATAAALEGVFAWDDSPVVEKALKAQLKPGARYRAAALAQCHAHGLSGGAQLALILEDPSSALVARALRSAGECGRADLLPLIEPWLAPRRGADPAIGYWAAWSSIVLGSADDKAFALLRAIAGSAAPHGREALRLLCLALPQQQLEIYLGALSEQALDARTLIEAAGWSGHPRFGPWLIEHMRIPALAPAAAEAFRLITGFDFEQYDARIDADAANPDHAKGLPYPPYPYPDIERVSAWWDDAHAYFDSRTRWFLGQPLTLDDLDYVLNQGEQAHRELAALHRAIAEPGRPLHPTRAHTAMQWQRLQELRGHKPT